MKQTNERLCALAQAGLNLDTDDLKQAGNLGLWKAVPKFDAARGMKFLTYAAPAIRNAMMDMVRDAFAAFEQGARENSGLNSPLGLPRWEQRITFA